MKILKISVLMVAGVVLTETIYSGQEVSSEESSMPSESIALQDITQAPVTQDPLATNQGITMAAPVASDTIMQESAELTSESPLIQESTSPDAPIMVMGSQDNASMNIEPQDDYTSDSQEPMNMDNDMDAQDDVSSLEPEDNESTNIDSESMSTDSELSDSSPNQDEAPVVEMEEAQPMMEEELPVSQDFTDMSKSSAADEPADESAMQDMSSQEENVMMQEPTDEAESAVEAQPADAAQGMEETVTSSPESEIIIPSMTEPVVVEKVVYVYPVYDKAREIAHKVAETTHHLYSYISSKVKSWLNKEEDSSDKDV